ncbi:MAG: CcoQ/FixQ family Cbb3-type cytochrome c oxidase assembly chaperone [Terrimonas sp.]|nr:CcoQ/FixQ family Cbb3-type cytochrome c oxidase assembly chaperone [Terrimonas sp.]
MLKYIKQYAESITGISIYPLISLMIFFLFFVAVLYFVKKMDKNKVEEISHLPLEDRYMGEEDNRIQNIKHA